MPDGDVHALMARVQAMGYDPRAEIAADLTPQENVTWRKLSLAEASVGARNSDVQRALDTPQSASDPRWTGRMPLPPCEECTQDHKPNKVYNHQYVHPMEVQRAREYLDQAQQDIPQVAYADQPTPIRKGVEREIVNRVAIYDSRTGYIVKVESPPEWDDVAKVKMDRDKVMVLLPLLKALGVRVKNNSEDEFDSADQSGPNPEPAREATPGDTRRSREAAEAEWKELLGGTDAPAYQPAPEHGDVGSNTDGQEAGAPRRGRTRKAS